MDLIFTVTTGKWKMNISLAVRVEEAIDSCVKSVALLPASYEELKVIFCDTNVRVVKNNVLCFKCCCDEALLTFYYKSASIVFTFA